MKSAKADHFKRKKISLFYSKFDTERILWLYIAIHNVVFSSTWFIDLFINSIRYHNNKRIRFVLFGGHLYRVPFWLFDWFVTSFEQCFIDAVIKELKIQAKFLVEPKNQLTRQRRIVPADEVNKQLNDKSFKTCKRAITFFPTRLLKARMPCYGWPRE